jgi:hypothetical protein
MIDMIIEPKSRKRNACINIICYESSQFRECLVVGRSFGFRSARGDRFHIYEILIDRLKVRCKSILHPLARQVSRRRQILCRDGLILAIDASDGIDIGWKWVIFRSSDPSCATKSTAEARQIRPRRKESAGQLWPSRSGDTPTLNLTELEFTSPHSCHYSLNSGQSVTCGFLLTQCPYQHLKQSS